jgi:SAM-dependent methyltransferase
VSIRLPWREQPISGVSIWSSLLDEESAKLRELALGKRVLEIGAAFGFSTSNLASTAKHVWSIDAHNIVPSWHLFGIETHDVLSKYQAGTLPILQQNLSDAGLDDKVTICIGYSQTLLGRDAPLADELRGKIDLAFIDGDHSVNGCLTDLENCARLLAPGGVLAVHDYDEFNNPGVKIAVDEWRKTLPMELFGTLAVIRL